MLTEIVDEFVSYTTMIVMVIVIILTSVNARFYRIHLAPLVIPYSISLNANK